MLIALNVFSRGIASLGGFLLSLIVAQIAGAEGLGPFAVFLSVLGILSIIARRGQDRLVTRAVAWMDHKAEEGTAVALLLFAASRALFPAITLGLIGSLLLASGWLGSAFPGTIVVMPLALLAITLLALVAGYAKGVSRAWIAPLFEIGGISLLATLILACMVLTGNAVPEVSITIALLAALLFLLILVAGFMIWRDMPGRKRLPLLDADQREEIRTGQVDFTLIALATYLTQAGSFVLAAPLLSGTDLGLLRAAERLAFLVSFPVLAINPVISPRIVRLSRGRDADGLRRLTKNAVLTSAGLSACFLLPLLIWPERALALMGADFTDAVSYLRLMAAAHFLSALIGPLAVLMNMSGRERSSMWINLTTLAIAIPLVPGLSMMLGASGFAVAYSAVIIARNALIAAAVFRGRSNLKNSYVSRTW